MIGFMCLKSIVYMILDVEHFVLETVCCLLYKIFNLDEFVSEMVLFCPICCFPHNIFCCIFFQKTGMWKSLFLKGGPYISFLYFLWKYIFFGNRDVEEYVSKTGAVLFSTFCLFLPAEPFCPYFSVFVFFARVFCRTFFRTG